MDRQPELAELLAAAFDVNELPLPLRSGERVVLIVLRKPEPSRWDPDRLREHAQEDLRLAETGMAQWCEALDEEDRL